MSDECVNVACVNVACGVLLNDKNEICMGLRPSNAVYEFPGGKQEAGETLEECLEREWREELCVDIVVGERIHDAVTVDGRAFHWHFFVGYIIDPENMRPQVHDHVAFFSIKSARALSLFDGDDAVLDAAEKWIHADRVIS